MLSQLVMPRTGAWFVCIKMTTFAAAQEAATFWAEFSYTGAWFKGDYNVNLPVSRVAFLKGAIDPSQIDEFAKRMAFQLLALTCHERQRFKMLLITFF